MNRKEQNNLLREARIKRLISIDAADAFKRLVAIEKRYNELIMAIESKFPGETRHETALRYIKDRENGTFANWSKINSGKLSKNVKPH